MEGIGAICSRSPDTYDHYDVLRSEWNRMAKDPKAVEYIRSKQPSSLLDKFNQANVTDFIYMEDPDLYVPFTYDAAMTVAMGACGASLHKNTSRLDLEEISTEQYTSNMSYFFTGPQLFESMRASSFEGASTSVSYIPNTCSRDYSGKMIYMENLRRNPGLNSDGMASFTFHNAATYSKDDSAIPGKAQWKPTSPFYFYNASAIPPIDFPPPNTTVLSISRGALAGGLFMSSLAIVVGLVCGVGILVYRKKKIVQASQPIFMEMICLGSVIIAMSVFPLSLQESSVSNKEVLDISCMLTPWLVCIGFVTSFSVLFAKTLRLNKVGEPFTYSLLEYISICLLNISCLFI